ncbi:MAG: MFS transporter [Actinobacteria bacterium]|nr:MFS transporter [Actinomycetota bacterium]
MRLPRLLPHDVPRPVLSLQMGGLLNAFGNGVVLPFLLIYFHNVRGISLGLSGLIVASAAVVALASGPFSGPVVDRFGGKRSLSGALVALFAGFVIVIPAEGPALAFGAMALVGLGNGFFWTAQSTLIAGHTTAAQRPSAFAFQRVAMNLGVGLGALAGGLIADADRPGSFSVIFVVNAATFVAYLLVLAVLVPDADFGGRGGAAAGRRSYRDVLRNRPFLGLIGLNALVIFAGMSGLELLPVFAKNETGVAEHEVGIVFLVNTLVIVVMQMPISRMGAGRSRMRYVGLLSLVWAGCWVGVAAVGWSLSATGAWLALIAVMAVFALGECLHGAVYGPLVADLAEPELMGRYMALSALSWQVGFSAGPAIGGFLLEASPSGTWLVLAALCTVAGALALVLEPRLPARVRRSPVAPADTASA